MSATTWQCIYCLEHKPASSYVKAEHVIPQSFGLFDGNNPTLHNVVCDDCNKHFGDNLELPLARDTIEGRKRFQLGLKPAKEFKGTGPSSRRILTISEEGPQKGAFGREVYNPIEDKLGLEPLPQIGIKLVGTEERRWFLINKLPEYSEIQANKEFDLKDKKGFLIIEHDSVDVYKVLSDHGFPYNKSGDFNEQGQPMLTGVKSEIDSVIIRAFSKITFNYLAYILKVNSKLEFIFQAEFDVARNFIRYGQEPKERIVNISNDAILHDELNATTRVIAHILAVGPSHDNKAIIGKVSLFNGLTYSVLLALGVDASMIAASGLLFDPHSKTVFPLQSDRNQNGQQNAGKRSQAG